MLTQLPGWQGGSLGLGSAVPYYGDDAYLNLDKQMQGSLAVMQVCKVLVGMLQCDKSPCCLLPAKLGLMGDSVSGVKRSTNPVQHG